MTEDRFQAEDLGDYGNQDGSFGVAYSFGCKNTPEDFIQRLQVQLPEDKGQFKRHRIGDGVAGDILRWDEYSIGQRVCLRDEYLFNPENPRDWAGIDCSGFAQNCTTYATFRPEGETERIVPETVVKDLKKTPGAEVGASAAIGNYARLMSYDKGNDGETHFLRGGDILTTESHIVIVDGTADQIVLVPPDAPPDPPPDDPDPLSLEFLGNCEKAVQKPRIFGCECLWRDEEWACIHAQNHSDAAVLLGCHSVQRTELGPDLHMALSRRVTALLVTWLNWTVWAAESPPQAKKPKMTILFEVPFRESPGQFYFEPSPLGSVLDSYPREFARDSAANFLFLVSGLLQPLAEGVSATAASEVSIRNVKLSCR